MPESSTENPSIKSRLATELKRYLLVSLYLFICFGVILVYDASQSPASAATLLLTGTALIKALVMGKFILIGEVLIPGTRIEAPTLLHRVAWRTLGMLMVLIILKLIEELIIGLAHGEGVSAIVGDLLARSWISLLGPILLMLLILIPLMMAIELGRVLGDGGLQGLLLRQVDQS